MDISSVNLSLNTLGTSTSQVQAGSDSQSPFATLQQKEGSAVAQLSAFGQVKASLADLQNNAQALKNFSKPPTFSDFQVVVQGFVQSFNSLGKNVAALTSKQGALNDNSRSGQALSHVNKAIAGANQDGLSALQKMGVTQQSNGTFSINQKQLEKSFQDNRPKALATVFDLANRVIQVTDKQISANGLIGKKVNDLSVRVKELGNTFNKAQGYIDTQKTFQQSLSAQMTNSGGFTASNAVAAYASVSAL